MEEHGMKQEDGEWTRLPGHDHEHHDMMGTMMCLAKEAHMELLKEKLKKRIDSMHGKKMDEMASVIADGMAMKMMMMMEAKKGKREMMEKIERIFMEK
jgi:hypothetical protein